MYIFCKPFLVGSNVGIWLNSTVKSGWIQRWNLVEIHGYFPNYFWLDIGIWLISRVQFLQRAGLGKKGMICYYTGLVCWYPMEEYKCENFVPFFCAEFYWCASIQMGLQVLILIDIFIAVLNKLISTVTLCVPVAILFLD